MSEQVVVVTRRDRRRGVIDKLAAHRLGLLHRALSVFLVDDDRILLQRRAAHKYHSAGLWTNACCTHPRPGEPVLTAARRRLREELGIDQVLLWRCGAFVYRTRLDNGLWEHEFDHLVLGRFTGKPDPNPEEVMDWRWATAAEVTADLRTRPGSFTAWFPLAWGRLAPMIREVATAS